MVATHEYLVHQYHHYPHTNEDVLGCGYAPSYDNCCVSCINCLVATKSNCCGTATKALAE